MAEILGEPGVLLFGRTALGAFVPVKVESDGTLSGDAGADIGGTIADTQVAVGDGANNITGDAGLTYNTGTNVLTVTGGVTIAGASATTGVGAYKIARGSTALDGSNPTTVATGLATVISFVANLRRTTALSTGTAFVTHDAPSGANVDVYGWILAGTASAGNEVFDWIAVGT